MLSGLFVYTINAQSACPNLGFSQNNFSSWTGYTGDFDTPNQSNGIVNGRHTIVTGGTDPNTCGGLTRVPPGATSAARLGNDNVNSEGEQLAYTMNITPDNAIFVYKYAAVLEDANHPASDQPRLIIKVTDQNGNTVGGSCGTFNVYAGQSGQNFQNCNGVKWLNWSTAAIDLSGMLGQTITITFTTRDCGQGAHFGYAYIWAQCMPMVQDAEFCAGQNALLTAPTGFQNYAWNTGATSNSITVTNPVDGSQYNCTLSSAGNQGSCAVNVKYQLGVTQPTANFTGTNACQNGTNSFTDASITNNNYVTGWSWNFGDGGTSTAQNPTHSYSTSGNFNVTLTAQTANGCTSSYTTPVTVYPAPTAQFNATNVCDYQSTQFTNQTTGSYAQLLWDLGDGTTTTNDVSITHTYASANTYNAQLIAISSQGCRDTIVKPVSVYPKPVADFSVSPVCLDLASNFLDASTVSVVASDAISNWNWTFNANQNATIQNPSNIFSSEGIHTVQLIVTTSNGCKDTIAKPATVYPLPVPIFSGTSACLGFSNFFNDQTSISNTYTSNQISSWSWNFNGSGNSSQQSPNFIFPSEGIFPVTLTTTSNHGCVDSITNNATIYPKPLAAFSVSSVCEGLSNAFTDQSTVSNAITSNQIATWSWNFGDNGSASIQNPTHGYTSQGIYNGTLIITTNHGCKDTVNNPVTVYPSPVANYIVNSVCQGLTSSFSDQSIVSNQFTTNTINGWTWTFGNNTGSTSQNPSLTYGQEGIFTSTLIITTNHGCKDTLSKPVTVFPNPVANFNASTVCEGFATSFTNSSLVSNQYTTNTVNNFSWQFGDGGVGFQEDPSHTYPSPGDFQATLIITTNNGCKDTVVKQVTIHPNPQVQFDGFDLMGCSPICPVVFSQSTVSSPSTIQTNNWYFSDGIQLVGDTVTRCLENDGDHTDVYGLTLVSTTNYGCKDSASINSYIFVYHNPIADFSFQPQEPDLIHNLVQFNNESLYANSYEWIFETVGQSNLMNPSIQFPFSPGEYPVTLIASTPHNCTDTITKVVPIKDVLLFYVPNTFTPDNDNFNEFFTPVFYSGFDPYDYELLIFNRWGELIFESHDVNVGWDGSYGSNNEVNYVQDGTYTWKIQFKRTDTKEKVLYVGHVNLLR